MLAVTVASTSLFPVRAAEAQRSMPPFRVRQGNQHQLDAPLVVHGPVRSLRSLGRVAFWIRHLDQRMPAERRLVAERLVRPRGWQQRSAARGPRGRVRGLPDLRAGVGLQDKRCSDGTWRTELFIHAEEKPDSGQYCTSDPDDLQCWDSTPAYPGASSGTNDLYSQGCIKVRRPSDEGSWPDAMSDVHSTWHDLGGGSGHGVPRPDSLYVHS